MSDNGNRFAEAMGIGGLMLLLIGIAIGLFTYLSVWQALCAMGIVYGGISVVCDL